jgi:hypothetical protein
VEDSDDKQGILIWLIPAYNGRLTVVVLFSVSNSRQQFLKLKNMDCMFLLPNKIEQDEASDPEIGPGIVYMSFFVKWRRFPWHNKSE